MNDVKDVLGLSQEEGTSCGTERTFIRPTFFRKYNGTGMKSVSVTALSKKTMGKPRGMNREVIQLLKSSRDEEANSKAITDDTDSGYKKEKLDLRRQKFTNWRWLPFTNPARKDNVMFHHWAREEDVKKEYPFAKYNKQVPIPSYTDEEYEQHLQSETWTRAETDHLFDLAQRFDLRFIVMCDRWDLEQFTKRSIEDIKQRYYEVRNVLIKIKGGNKEDLYVFDADHEKKRKEHLERLYTRTREQEYEEFYLLHQLQMFEARRKKEEEDYLRWELQISQEIKQETGENEEILPTSTICRRGKGRQKHRGRAKKTPKSKPFGCGAVVLKSHEIEFPDIEEGVYLQSEKLKLPAQIHPKQVRAIEKVLIVLDVDLDPMPTDDICFHFTHLLKTVVLQIELKSTLESRKHQLKVLRRQYELLNPGKTLIIPPALL